MPEGLGYSSMYAGQRHDPEGDLFQGDVSFPERIDATKTHFPLVRGHLIRNSRIFGIVKTAVQRRLVIIYLQICHY